MILEKFDFQLTSQRVEKRPEHNLEEHKKEPQFFSLGYKKDFAFIKAGVAFSSLKKNDFDLNPKRVSKLPSIEVPDIKEYTSQEIEQNMTEFEDCILYQKSNNPEMNLSGSKGSHAQYR